MTFALIWVCVAAVFVLLGRSLDRTLSGKADEPGHAAMACYCIGGCMALMAAGFVL